MRQPHQPLQTDVLIVGGGLAGLVAAHELLSSGHRVLVVDRDSRENLGGMAKASSGGVFMVGTPYQGRLGIEDSSELAWKDWERVAEYDAADDWPRRWGEYSCVRSRTDVFEFLRDCGVRFLPAVQWAERSFDGRGNRVPRWHMVWGLGGELIRRVVTRLERHPRRKHLEFLFDTEIRGLETSGDRVTGASGWNVKDQRDVRIDASHVIIASGGIGGDLARVRSNWYAPWGSPPAKLLNGGHLYGDGALHDVVERLGGTVTHLDRHWYYASGIHHPAARRPDDGLSLVPARSALWFNACGERLSASGSSPSLGSTREVVAHVLEQPGQYSWQVMNWKIATRELMASGMHYLTAFRKKSWVRLALTLAFGNRQDTRRLMRECSEDIVVADSLPDLMDGMDAKNLYGLRLDRARLTDSVRAWDNLIERGAEAEDEQLRRIAQVRSYAGDRMRTCRPQTILAPKARPLIAIREFVLTRKTLGGIQTDLQCRVMRSSDGEPIAGLYAVGEAAGFGGGGSHGKGSLEGTFLAGCVLTGRVAGRSIAAAE